MGSKIRVGVGHVLVFAGSVGACAMPIEESGTPAENDRVEQSIMNGSAAPTTGPLAMPAAVQITNQDGLSCSGFLFGPNQLLTAGHCFEVSGTYLVKVWQKTATSGNTGQCINSFEPSTNSICTASGRFSGSGATWASVFVHPNFDPDDFSAAQADDLAVVWVGSGWGAPANTSANWLRILAMKPLVGWNFLTYGWGPESDTGFPTDALRYAVSQFAAVSSNGLLKSYAGVGGWACAGDSGAPLVLLKQDELDYNLAYGIHTASENGVGLCAENGDIIWDAGLWNRIAWIDSVIPYSCVLGNSGSFPYARCW